MTDDLSALITAATAADGQPPFSDQSLVDYSTGIRRLLTVGAVGSLEGTETFGAALVEVRGGCTEAELVVHPDARRHGLGERLVSDVIAMANGALLVWAHGDHPAARVLAERYTFTPVRELLQLRSVVRIDGRTSTSSANAIRPFRPGSDDAAWLDLNAQAFADHAEQGKMTQHDLDARKAEAWFDAGDFLLLWDDDELIGFCWLKVGGGLGEFYAVGVAPGRQGEGIGRVLVEAGLNRLAERGIRESNLYVEADNEPAVRLYRSYGFTNHTVDVQYRRDGQP
ncbi:MAG: mycothiol synthase [Homoserinimonas sp.]